MTQASDQVLQNVQTIAELEKQAIKSRSPVERLTDAITQGAGSIQFVIAHALIFGGWMAVNRWVQPLDPFPFSLLNLGVSLEAIFLTSFVLMTQNRMTKQADRRTHIDLQVNLLAEQELTAILHMLHALSERAGVKVNIRDPRIKQMLRQTDVQKLAVTLDRELPDEKGHKPHA